MSKIGIGIVTFNRETELKRLYDSLPLNIFECLVIVNDGERLHNIFDSAVILENEINLGVGKSKNRALKFLLSNEVDYIFLIEDDLYIKDVNVFEKYINAHKRTGIHHFNYALHGELNVTLNGKPNKKMDIMYNNDNLISLYENCVGAFSFFTRNCLETVGLYDEEYFNALEHVDHTYQIVLKGFHPPFWFFADIQDSDKYIGDDGWSLKKSVISNNPKLSYYQKNARGYFFYKNKIDLFEINKESSLMVLSSLNYICMKYGENSQIKFKRYYFMNFFNKFLFYSKSKFMKLISKFQENFS